MTTMGRTRNLAGAGLILVGVLLLVGALAYSLFGAYSRSRLGDLVVPASGGVPSLRELQRDLAPSSPAGTGPAVTQGTVPTGEGVPQPPAPSAQGDAPEVSSLGEEEVTAPTAGALAAPRPGTGFDFRTLRAEAASSASGSILGSQFQPVDWTTLPFSMEALPAATRIQIPAIDLDSRVVELNTKWNGESLVWETAVYAVGHHHGSPNPGEQGNAVFSGHISSPVSRQGAVFKRLPEVAALLREGRTVDIIVEASEMRYLYRAISTDVKAPHEVDVFRPTEVPSLTLVTCVPDYIYSDRFLVNAVLVGVARKA